MNESVVFGYRPIDGLPTYCPCGDNRMCMTTGMEGSLRVDQLRCWCGSFTTITWDSPEERASFIATNAVDDPETPK